MQRVVGEKSQVIPLRDTSLRKNGFESHVVGLGVNYSLLKDSQKPESLEWDMSNFMIKSLKKKMKECGSVCLWKMGSIYVDLGISDLGGIKSLWGKRRF